MADTTTVTVRLDADVKARLEALARSTRRNTSALAAEAIAAYLDANAWQIEQIDAAVAKADADGPFIPHERVTTWVGSLDTDDPLPPPKP